jgi:hypothetical protein
MLACSPGMATSLGLPCSHVEPVAWEAPVMLSSSSVHGHGFFRSDISFGDTLARLTVGEAIVGLLIVITFIATFTQRFFSSK